MSSHFGEDCRATARTVSTLLLQMAEEASTDGVISLAELQRIVESIDGMGPIFEMLKVRCIKNSRCNGISFRRNQLLGRIVAQPLETQLFASPPVLDRRLLSPLFRVMAKMVGEPLFQSLEERSRKLYFSKQAEPGQFEWVPFYESGDALSNYCQLMVMLSRAFQAYAEAKKQFISLMMVEVPGFNQAAFFQLICGVVHPLKLPSKVSRHRAFMERALLPSEQILIEEFIGLLDGDSKQWKLLGPKQKMKDRALFPH